MGEDPRPRRRTAGRCGIEPLRLGQGGRRRGPVAGLPQVPALSFEQAGRPLRVDGRDRRCAMARRPSSTAAAYSPIRTAVSAARTRISIRSRVVGRVAGRDPSSSSARR